MQSSTPRWRHTNSTRREKIRVALARALASHPRLLVVDEPTLGVDLVARDSILRLIRSIADEGIAVLTSTGEAPCLAGTDRALTISDGRLRGAAGANRRHRGSPPARKTARSLRLAPSASA